MAEGAERIDEFMNEAKVFFLATVDGDKPKNRPLGFHLLKDGKLYFGVGNFKDVYKHLQGIYNDETGFKMAIFHLEEATAEIRDVTGKINESYNF